MWVAVGSGADGGVLVGRESAGVDRVLEEGSAGGEGGNFGRRSGENAGTW